MTQAQKTSKKKIERLQPLECPEETFYIYELYIAIRSGEQLSCQELLAWSKLTKHDLTVLEVSLIRMLDQTFWKIYNDRNRTTRS